MFVSLSARDDAVLQSYRTELKRFLIVFESHIIGSDAIPLVSVVVRPTVPVVADPRLLSQGQGSSGLHPFSSLKTERVQVRSCETK